MEEMEAAEDWLVREKRAPLYVAILCISSLLCL